MNIKPTKSATHFESELPKLFISRPFNKHSAIKAVTWIIVFYHKFDILNNRVCQKIARYIFMPVFQLTESIIFPPPELARSDGLLAIGGDLSEARLLLAYEQGIFPWYSQGEPILWWAPAPRLVLEPKKFRISKRLAREIRKNTFKITMDQAFSEVIMECADIRVEQGEGTWITNEMKSAYVRLHELGYAHSVECWQEEKLAGGLYGVSLGTVFFGESMFSRVSNSSKTALATLARILTKWKFDMIDCQITTSHLLSLGAQQINGREFYTRLQKYVRLPTRRGKWHL